MTTSCGTTSGVAALSVGHELADRVLNFYTYMNTFKELMYSDDTTRFYQWCGSPS